MVHILLKSGLENFEHYFASVWDECNCSVVWAFFGIAFVWDWNENWPFPVLWPLLSFPNLLAYWVQHFHSIIFRIWNSSAGNPSPPLALFTAMLPKTHLTSHSRMSDSRWVITPSWLSGAWRSFCSVTFYCTPKWTHHTYTYIPPFRTSVNSVLITVPRAMHCALPFCDQVQISGRQFFYQPARGGVFQNDSSAWYLLYICLFTSILLYQLQLILHQIIRH